MPTAHSEALRGLAQLIANDIPQVVAGEILLTGSASRGMADELSDIEMLIVTNEELTFEECFKLAREASLEELDTWGDPRGPARRVFGYRDRVPIELIWWPRTFAEAQLEAVLRGELPSTADAFVRGLILRTQGLLSKWQERLGSYPDKLAAAQIENAALPWGGFAPTGLLTLLREGDRLALVKWLVGAASGVLTIVFAINRVWEPTPKRLAVRVQSLAQKPNHLAQRIEEALTEPDARRALLLMTELQLETVFLAPSGPYVNRARSWLARGAEILGSPQRHELGSSADS